MIDNVLKNKILRFQKNEVTEQEIYHCLAAGVKNKEHAQVLEKISQEEKKHSEFWQSLTGQKAVVDKTKVAYYCFISRFLGLTFGLKLMENGEGLAQEIYAALKPISGSVAEIIQDEERHERELIGLIDEERLKYVGSVVLGLNDALVELTGALVGFTLALQNARLVGLIGLITGIAAALSMAASEYLSTKEEDHGKSARKACIYTGTTYFATVLLLITPYLFFKNIYLCLSLVVLVSLSLILFFTYYVSVAKDLDFKKRFLEMAGISLGVAAVNYCIGLVIRNVFGIQV